MDTIIHADIFFFITACAVVVLTIILGIILIYGVFVAKNVHYIVSKVKKESDNISDDIYNVRLKIKEQSTKILALMAFLKNMAGMRTSKGKGSSSRDDRKTSSSRRKSSTVEVEDDGDSQE